MIGSMRQFREIVKIFNLTPAFSGPKREQLRIRTPRLRFLEVEGATSYTVSSGKYAHLTAITLNPVD